MSNSLLTDHGRGYRFGQSVTSGAACQSAFVRFLHYCRRETLDVCDLSQLVSTHWATESLFHLTQPVSANLRRAIGASECDWETALGTDLIVPLPPKVLMVSGLRYCQSCLQQGWHAAVFQHVGAMSCPVHGERLKTGCPHCGHSIDTSCRAIIENHHYCAHCSRPIGVFDTADLEGPVSRAGLADLHNALRAVQDEEFVASNFAHVKADQVLKDQGLALGVAMHRLWPKRRLKFIRCFPNVVHRGPSSGSVNSISHLYRSSWAGTVRALLQVSACLKENDCFLASPWEPTVDGRRIGARAWLASAALWRTVHAFGAQKYLELGRLLPQDPHPFRFCMPKLPWAARRVAEAQVFNLFALNLLDLRKHTSLTQLPAEYLPPAIIFLPPWRLRETRDEAELVMRQRVSFELVKRLVRRYRTGQLHVRPA